MILSSIESFSVSERHINTDAKNANVKKLPNAGNRRNEKRSLERS